MERDTNNPIRTESDVKVREGLSELRAQVALLNRMLREQQAQNTKSVVPAFPPERTTKAIEERISRLKVRTARVASGEYQTPVRPADRDPGSTAHKAAETFAKIPYYIPGTNEIGEFYVEPTVNDQGEMVFKLRFLDPDAASERTRLEVPLSLPEVIQIQNGLLKLETWSAAAHRNKIRKNYAKRIACFAAEDCPAEGETREGRSSTELKFQVNDEGLTSGVIQRNKGRYVEAYNFSIDSGLLLGAYLQHVTAQAKLDYQAGTQTKEDLDRLFQ